MSCTVLHMVLVHAIQESRSRRVCLQDRVDLSNKGHPDVDGGLCDGAAKLELIISTIARTL